MQLVDLKYRFEGAWFLTLENPPALDFYLGSISSRMYQSAFP